MAVEDYNNQRAKQAVMRGNGDVGLQKKGSGGKWLQMTKNMAGGRCTVVQKR